MNKEELKNNLKSITDKFVGKKIMKKLDSRFKINLENILNQ